MFQIGLRAASSTLQLLRVRRRRHILLVHEVRPPFHLRPLHNHPLGA